MAELIEYSEGKVLVEVVQNKERARPVSDRDAERITKNFDQAVKAVEPLLRSVTDTVVKSVEKLPFKSAEIELGLSFTAEGSVFVTKASAEANLKVTITLGRDK